MCLLELMRTFELVNRLANNNSKLKSPELEDFDLFCLCSFIKLLFKPKKIMKLFPPDKLKFLVKQKDFTD